MAPAVTSGLQQDQPNLPVPRSRHQGIRRSQQYQVRALIPCKKSWYASTRTDIATTSRLRFRSTRLTGLHLFYRSFERKPMKRYDYPSRWRLFWFSRSYTMGSPLVSLGFHVPRLGLTTISKCCHLWVFEWNTENHFLTSDTRSHSSVLCVPTIGAS